MGDFKANLFIAGEQKTGTTTLHNILSHHSKIYMSPIKEPGYFCSDLHEDSDKHNGEGIYFPIRTEQDYTRQFKGATDQKFLGDGSSLYLYSSRAAKEIRKYDPNSKIIIIFREPVSFLHSLHSQYVKEGGEDVTTFEQALSLGSLRMSGENLPNNTRAPKLLFYNERIKYSEHLDRYFQNFDGQDILVLISDNFMNDPDGTYRLVLDFLGLQYEKVPLKRMNQGGAPRNEFIRRLSTGRNVERLKRIIANKLPPDQVSKLVSKYHKISRKSSKREKIEPILHEELRNQYKTEVYQLDELLHSKGYEYDLRDMWGY